jgi:uncharacterized membrane protein YgdD (TMEM256/DUF423 family)
MESAMRPEWLIVAALNGAIAVAAGAFGAHGLKDHPGVEVFKTGAHYQMVHALALLAIALLPRSAATTAAGACFLAGIVIFSGTLYLLTLTGVRWLGAITPVGGVLLIAGWALLALAGWQMARQS